MRFAWLVLIAACGRVDFAEQAARGDGSLDAVAEPGLVVWYRMEDDPADGQIDDSAGDDQPALCVAGLTCGTAVPGHTGSGLHLDGVQQFYRLLSDPTLVTPTAFTVAVWARVDGTGLERIFTKRYAAVLNSWGLASNASDLYVYESANAAVVGSFDSIAPLQRGVWVHLAISWDNVTKRGYVNGVRLLDKIVSDIAFDDREVLLGVDEDDGTGQFAYFNGAIDDARIYDRKLSDFEIMQLAQQ